MVVCELTSPTSYTISYEIDGKQIKAGFKVELEYFMDAQRERKAINPTHNQAWVIANEIFSERR